MGGQLAELLAIITMRRLRGHTKKDADACLPRLRAADGDEAED